MTIAFPRRSGQHAHRPEMFQAWAPRMPKSNSGLAAAVEELVTIYGDFYSRTQKAALDETSTPGARLVKSAKDARARLLPAVERLNKAADDASAAAAQLAAKTAQAYNPPDKKYETVIRHQEIRAHFKSLPQRDRLSLLNAAQKDSDQDTLVALASYQPYLSGLPPEMHQHTRDTLIEAHAPKEAAALAGITEQRKFAEQLRDTMLQSVSNLVDFQKADEIIAAASADLA